jgi:pilus assembly protein CpaE
VNTLTPISLNLSGGGSTGVLVAFVQDEATRSALVAALGADWPAATVHGGGVNEAIVHLAGDPAARTVVVDLSGAADAFKSLDRLAEVCTPGTTVIALGDVNDVTLYRRLRSVGVIDYLVKPVTAEAFGHALHTAAQPPVVLGHDKTARPSGDVVAVIGARGGIGVTFVASTLAWLFAEEAQRRTMLVDLDLQWGTSGLAFDVETSHGLCEVLTNPERIDSLFVSSATAPIGDRLSLLASEEPLDNFFEARPGALELLLKETRRNSDRVVLDVPRHSPDLMRRALGEASVIVIVTDFSLAGLRDAGRLATLAEQIAPDAKRHIVGNRLGANKKGELSIPEMQKALKTTLAAIIPEDRSAVLHAINTGKPLPKVAPNSKAVAALRTLAQLFDKETAKPTGVFARLFGRTPASDKEPAKKKKK